MVWPKHWWCVLGHEVKQSRRWLITAIGWRGMMWWGVTSLHYQTRSGVEGTFSMTCGCRVVNCDPANIHRNHMSLVISTNWISIFILFSIFIKFDTFLNYVSIFWCTYTPKKSARDQNIKISRKWSVAWRTYFQEMKNDDILNSIFSLFLP